MMYLIATMSVTLALTIIFFLLSKKEYWEKEIASVFECGFTAYFYSRFSFSIHYFMIALLFLFLDLELCFIMPFFNEQMTSTMLLSNAILFVSLLLLGLTMEWMEKKLEWKF